MLPAKIVAFFTFLIFFLFVSCSRSSDQSESDPRFSPAKKYLLKQQVKVASSQIKNAVTYAFDCNEGYSANAQVLEWRTYDEGGKLLSQEEVYFNGTRKKKVEYHYDAAGDKTRENLFNSSDRLIQTKHFNKLGFDTLINNFFDDGALRNSIQKFLEYTPEGFVKSIQEIDNLNRTHSFVTFVYNDTLLVEEEFAHFNPMSGNPVGTEIIRYNERGDRAYMSSSTGTTIDEEATMEYRYNEHGKIENARLYNGDGMLIREKNNTFYSGGIVKSITDTYYDPLDGAVTQVFEELYTESGNLLSTSLKNAEGALLRSSDFTYDENGLLVETMEFDPGQSPAYLCTRLAYEFYN